MLPPEFLAALSDEAAMIFSEAEAEIINDIVKRVAKMGGMTESSVWQAYKVREAGALQGKTKRLVEKASGLSEKQIRQIMKEAAEKGLEYDDAIYREAGLKPVPVFASPALQAIYLQGITDTLTIIGNYTKSMAETAQKAFYKATDKAFIQITTGQQSPQTAIRRAIHEVASQGIEKIAYPSGSRSSVETAVRRAVTTGVNQSVAKLQVARAEELGTDLVEVTSHGGARPEHAVWQGGIYSLRGVTKGYRTLADACGYGTGEGLCGWNCYHSFYPYFEGLSAKSFSRDPSADAGKDNNEEYELSQKQRYYERQVRSAKKEVQALGVAVDSAATEELAAELKADFDRCSAKLKARRNALQEFLEKYNRQPLPEREVVGGWNRSISMRAVWGAKRKR